MYPITRLFESEAAAHAAAEKLLEAEVPREDIMVINPGDYNAADTVDRAIEEGTLQSAHRQGLHEALQRGRWVVSSTPHFLIAGTVENIMESNGAVDLEALPEMPLYNPAPLSDLLGIPVLLDSKSQTGLFKFDKTSSFGFNLISHNPAPLSSLFGLPLLTKNKGSRAKGSAVERMSGNPAPFSSMFKLKLLSDKKGSRAKGSAVERLSGTPAPFSSFLGLRVLSKRD